MEEEKSDLEKIRDIIDSSYKPRSEFNLNKSEQVEYGKFIEEHRKSCPDIGAIGGAYSITFNITTLGLVKTVKCSTCKKEKNITDYSNW